MIAMVVAGLISSALAGVAQQPQPNELRPETLTLRVDRDQLSIAGKALPLPTERQVLVEVLGAPSRVWTPQSRVSSRRSTILIWDELGLIAYEDHDGVLIVGVNVALGPSGEDFWPKKLFSGALSLDGAAVSANTTIASLNRTRKGTGLFANDPTPSIDYGDVSITISARTNGKLDRNGTLGFFLVSLTSRGRAKQRTLAGRVVQAQTGVPIKGATVELGSSGRTVTNEDGRYLLEVEHASEATVKATAEGHEPLSKTGITLRSRNTAIDFELETFEQRDYARVMKSTSYSETAFFIQQYPESSHVSAVRERLARFQRTTVKDSFLVSWDDARRSRRSDLLSTEYSGRETPRTLEEISRGRPRSPFGSLLALLQVNGEGIFSPDRLILVKEGESIPRTDQPITPCRIVANPRRGGATILFDWGETGCWDLNGPLIPVGSTITFPATQSIHVLGLDVANGGMSVRNDGLLLHAGTTLYWISDLTGR